MVWAVAKASRAFAVMWSLRHTLKTLKKVSRTESETLSDCRQRTAACSDALLFWVVFGFVVVWEQYFEVFTRWFPGYYYLKSAVLVLISFPKLRISHLAFGHVVVPLLELFYAHCGGGSIPSALTLLRLLPLVTIAIMFPNIVYHDLGGSPVLSESSLCDDGPPAERRGETDAIESVAVADPRDEEEATEAETAPETEEPEEAVLWEADYSWDPPPAGGPGRW